MWACVQEAFAFAIRVWWEEVSRRNTWCFMIWNQLTMAQLIKKTLHNIDKKWFTNFALCSFTINGMLQRNLWNIAHYYGLLQLARSHYIGRFVLKDYYKVSKAFQSFQYQGKMNSHRNSFVSSNLMNIIIINIKKLYLDVVCMFMDVYFNYKCIVGCWYVGVQRARGALVLCWPFKLVTPFS
jgi:hypothetical protein